MYLKYHGKRIFVLALIFVSFYSAKAQPVVQAQQGSSQKAMQKVLAHTHVQLLLKYAIKLKQREDSSKALALKMAKEKGWPVRQEFKNGKVKELMGVTPGGQPLYYETMNTIAAQTVSTNKVQPGGSSGLDLDGTGMIVGEWDGGDVRSTHQEFNNTGSNRVVDEDGPTGTSDHSTHVAGTLIAGGVDPLAKGMAFNGTLHAWDWNSDISEMSAAAANGLLISNHSYGFVTGWNYDPNTDSWTWEGDPSISNTEDYFFGFYDYYCVEVDYLAHNAPYYLPVWAAGNDQGDWNGFSTLHPQDGGPNGYDCIGHIANAKDVLTVGAIHDIPGGYTQPSDAILASFSSTGPCDDSRIKPDIVGNGTGVYSCTAASNYSYDSYSGTSMATPNVTGSLALLQEYYEQQYGEYMRASTLKALVIATADEAGPNPGPDYKFGWGVLNTATAASVITNNNLTTKIDEETYSGTSQTYTFTALGNGPLTATIAWTDPAGTPPPASLDPTNQMLVNDLDLKITSGGNTYYPYKLSAANPSAAATTGVNHADNVEKVVIANATAGATYTVHISNTGSISGGSQDYALIVRGITNTNYTDLTPTHVYGLTHIGQATGQTTALYANIVNLGQTTQLNVPIQLVSTGANPDSLSAMIDSIAPGDTLTVEFTGYTPDNMGASTITVSVPDDDNNNNNSATLTQVVNQGLYSYLDSSGYLVNYNIGLGTSSGAVLVKYPVNGTRTISNIQVYLVAGTGHQIRPVVMDSLGNILAHGNVHTIISGDLHQWLTLDMTTDSAITNTKVYAGIELFASGNAWFPLGVEHEDPAHPDAYYTGSLGGGTAVSGPTRAFNRWMIRMDACQPISAGYSVQGPTNICAGTPVTFNIDSAGTNSYHWFFPNGWASNSSGTLVTATPNSNSGYVIVEPASVCGSGYPDSLYVNVSSSATTTESVTICHGDSYTFADGTTHNNIQTPIVHTNQLQNVAGCDSLVLTTVHLYPTEQSTESQTICYGSSFTFPDGSTQDSITNPLTHSSVFQGSHGCDSTVVTHIYLHNISPGTETLSVCAGGTVHFPDNTQQDSVFASFSHTSVLQSVDGCDSTVVSMVQISQADTSISSTSTSLIAAANQMLYAWVDCNNSEALIPGATNMSFSPVSSGNYAVIVTNNLGCSDTSSCFTYIATGLANNASLSRVKIYPNPAHNQLIIAGKDMQKYMLIDITGKILMQGDLENSSEQKSISIAGFSRGLYLLKVFTRQGIRDFRVTFE